MDYKQLVSEIKTKKSFLCVGLDSDIEKIPAFLLQEEDAVFEFNKKIIEATSPYCIAYKINTAFYESRGLAGWKSLQKTIVYLQKYHPDVFTIADAKRADIGNTSRQYAKAFFAQKNFSFDAITVAPYMGFDSVEEFLNFNDKWVILLGLTSNAGAKDFQYIKDESGTYLFEQVLETSKKWANEQKIMHVVGATQSAMLRKIRKIIPHHFLLVPGLGVQGGSFKETVENGINPDCGLIINSSRGIIFKSKEIDFDQIAALEAKSIQQKMEKALQKHKII